MKRKKKQKIEEVAKDILKQSEEPVPISKIQDILDAYYNPLLEKKVLMYNICQALLYLLNESVRLLKEDPTLFEPIKNDEELYNIMNEIISKYKEHTALLENALKKDIPESN